MKKLEETQIQELVEKAIGMMDHSYVPYSHFHVGAGTTGEEWECIWRLQY